MNRMLTYLAALIMVLTPGGLVSAPLNLSQTPLFLTDAVPPLTMLVLGRDHKLYYPAYNDASDINGNGQYDLQFNPGIDYYGLFDSYKCYAYSGGDQYFYPVSVTADKRCPGNWSGNFLNYVTTARLDGIRKVLYGGKRVIDQDNFTVIERTYIPQDGHSFGKEFTSLAINGYNISDYTPLAAPASNRHHLFANTTLRNGTSAPLLRVASSQPYRIWEWLSIERPVAGSRALNGASGPLITGITDYVVRVRVCNQSVGLEANCRTYPNGNHKPIGLLQEFGENNSMYFGLLTGSYNNNLRGGVLRKNVSSITDEIDPNTGRLTTVNGIISTIDSLTVVNFNTDYTYSCGWITDRNINNGECRMWGNPIAEMMYETVRYFAGKNSPTSSFATTGGSDGALGLPTPTWQNPYSTYPYCSQANMLIISDLYPTYDSDQVPGSSFSSFSGDLSFNASDYAQRIFTGEGFSSVNAFIGQTPSNNDGAPTPKTVTSFANIRGLAPHETNSEGSYYSAAVAYYAWTNDVSSAEKEQTIKSFVVALSSPNPEFRFRVGSNIVTIVPFGKSVGATSGFTIDKRPGRYQPNNNIVSYFIDEISDTHAIFRVNFEDVQQGADFDMDAIVEYRVQVNADNTITIQTLSTYAAGSIVQHMGYSISGTTNDGLYLEVRDFDTSQATDVNYAYFLDTPPGLLPGQYDWENAPQALPLSASRTFTASSQPPAIVFKSPLWYAAKWGGFDDQNGSITPDSVDEWDKDLDGNPDNFFLISNPTFLQEQLAKALELIIDRTGSFSSAALSSGFLADDTRIYQAIFRTVDWSGQLLAFNLDPTTGQVLTTGSASLGAVWDAAQRLKTQNFNTGRQIITYKPSTGTGIPFRWPANPLSPSSTELDLAFVQFLSLSPISGLPDTEGNLRLNYIRGDTSQELRNGGTYRNRVTPLGDIINSNPVVIGSPQQNYPTYWGASAPENSSPHSNFKNSRAGRTSVIYVGANDGMLHAFKADDGQELFAFVPTPVIKNLPYLTSQDYVHRYYVDGSPTVVDAFVDSTWKTILVGSLGGGGQGIFALNVTNPDEFRENFAASMVEWEFTDAQDRDLGFTYGTPAIVRMANGKWAAVFGNGYNNTVADGLASTTGNAVLYIVDLETGAIIKKFDTGVGMSADPLGQGRPNGMSSPIVVDATGDSVANIIYAGDLFGNLWRIDVSSSNPNQWDFTYKQGSSPRPLFIAQDANGNRQPITTRPAVSRVTYSPSIFQIYFGTGSYIQNSDKTDSSIQSVYALRDSNTGRITSRSELRQQTILGESNGMRITSNNQLANNDKGWFMDLVIDGQARGERVISNMLFLSGKIIFSTIIPTDNPCDFGGESWLMELNALTGSRLNYNVFDINNDGLFNNGDSFTGNLGGQDLSDIPVSGIKSEVGLISTPAILNAGEKEFKYLPGTSGGIQRVGENPGAQIFGRQSWKQLR